MNNNDQELEKIRKNVITYVKKQLDDGFVVSQPLLTYVETISKEASIVDLVAYGKKRLAKEGERC